MTVRDRLDLYPPLAPYREHRLAVGSGHILHVEECGNPNGQPALIIHGGPGGGSNPTMRRYHNPDRYRIVLFDQRGCGRSTPNASLDNNTTADLVADIERIRNELAIERLQLFGGSWGSTLALAYAEAYPEHVSAMILRGIFLLTKAELALVLPGRLQLDLSRGIRRVPTHHPTRRARRHDRRLPSPVDVERSERSPGCRSRLEHLGGNDAVAHSRARSRRPLRRRLLRIGLRTHRKPLLRQRRIFSPRRRAASRSRRLKGIPGVIVHGRYDVVTPVKSAVLLNQAWAESDLRIVADAGHAMTEPGIVHELIRATRKFASGNAFA